MKKDEIFFGAQGLTSTHASYLSNVAKEAYQQTERELSNVRFVNKSMSLIGNAAKDIVSEGLTTVSDFNEKLDRVAKLKSLIAWCREAVSAKERLTREAENFSYEDFGIELPEPPVDEPPVKPTFLTADDVVATWNIKQRNRYYYLETLCAQYGKFIHPDGSFSKARETMLDRLNNPRDVSANGRDTIVYLYEPSINPKDVEDKFMELQNKYRDFQAELNSMKHEIELALDEDTRTKNLEYETAYNNYRVKYQEECDNFRHTMEAKSAELKTRKNEALQTIRNLKIVIPDSLKGVYEEVSSLGKK
ncbi:MAG: hypothetical protein J6X18_01075 [Bacteroidales bacterium]|nr:hypothetical protein [Bacteroidales bacterium]